MVEIDDDLINGYILIVDDVPINLRLLVQICERGGYRVFGASSGEQAIKMALEIVPDLILLDVMLPDLDGYGVAAKLKEIPDLCNIPIIFISARNDLDSKVKAFTAGGVDYVTKPIRMEEILARVGIHLRLRNLNLQLQKELEEKEYLITRLHTTNQELEEQVEERKQTERRLESTLKLLQDTLQRTRAMNHIARSLIGEETLDDILRVIAGNLVTALPADRIILVTLAENADAIDRYVVDGEGAYLETQPTYEVFMAGLSGWVINKVQPVISPKNIPDPRESTEQQKERVKRRRGSVIVVPLYYHGAILGTITAVNKTNDWDFNQIHLDLIAAIASQAAVVITNLRLAAETDYLKQFNEGIVQGVADAILVSDTEMRITYANPAATTLLGYTSSELKGKLMSFIMSEPGLLGECDDDNLWRLGLGCQGIETELKPKDGRKVSVLLSAQLLSDQDNVTGMLATFTDISELKEAAAVLEQYAKDLEAQNAELDAFAHTVAHDLKNPLTSVIGFSSILTDRFRDLPEEILNHHIAFISRSAQTMNNIIRELLLLASVREKHDIPKTVLSMGEIVKEVIHRLEYLISESGAVINMPDSWPGAVGYGPWIEEVWVNYISNGIKYGGRPDQFIVPQLSLGADKDKQVDEDGQHRVRFWIKDNGPGLSLEERHQLFTPFERLHNVHTEGHGLGLSIVQRIVEKLGGEVFVDSVKGEGSTFYFTLPAVSGEDDDVYNNQIPPLYWQAGETPKGDIE